MVDSSKKSLKPVETCGNNSDQTAKERLEFSIIFLL
jgi:hypothetical protein